MKLCRAFAVYSAFIFVCAAALNAQDEKKPRPPLKALVEVHDADVIEKKPFIITILVNHPVPDELNIEPPDFNDEFFFERLRMSTHIINTGRGAARYKQIENDDDSNKWTELEITLIAVKEGELTLGPWKITSPEYSIATLPLQIGVLPPKKNQNIPPALVWSGAESIRRGESGIAALRIANWEPRMTYPRELRIAAIAPRNAIVEQLAIPKTEELRGSVLRMSIRPLDGSTIRFDARTIRYHDWYLVIPELTIKVIGTPPASSDAPPAPLTVDAIEKDSETSINKKNTTRLRFPADDGFSGGLLAVLDGESFAACVSEARAAWYRFDYTAALARLRAGERDLCAGGAISRLRRAAETELELPLQTDELWLPRRLFIALGVIGAMFIVWGIIARIMRRAAVKRWAGGVLFLAAALCGIIIARVHERRGAILHAAPLYDVPEEGKSATAFFDEGIPVRIKTHAGVWLYVETAGGTSGWIPEARAVRY